MHHLPAGCLVSACGAKLRPSAPLRACQEGGAAVKEMEAAAIAYVASMFQTPVIAIKAITDIVDGEKPTGA